ncbi:hypothetical protein EJ110_NYTH27988 [Nymphaea thermarum]|nr:hypothetical protein EJ110_NYTH27988 [Nymphaea thermarum]
MEMKLKSTTIICSFLIVLLLGNVLPSAAQCGNLQILINCDDAYRGAPPSQACCSALRSLLPCFCYYARNPQYSQVMYGPIGQRISKGCRIPYPRC